MRVVIFAFIGAEIELGGAGGFKRELNVPEETLAVFLAKSSLRAFVLQTIVGHTRTKNPQ